MTQKHGLLSPRPRLALHPLPVHLLTLSHVGAYVQESPAASLLSRRDLLPDVTRPLTVEEEAGDAHAVSFLLGHHLQKQDLHPSDFPQQPATAALPCSLPCSPLSQTPSVSSASGPSSLYDGSSGCSPLAPLGSSPNLSVSEPSPKRGFDVQSPQEFRSSKSPRLAVQPASVLYSSRSVDSSFSSSVMSSPAPSLLSPKDDAVSSGGGSPKDSWPPPNLLPRSLAQPLPKPASSVPQANSPYKASATLIQPPKPPPSQPRPPKPPPKSAPAKPLPAKPPAKPR